MVTKEQEALQGLAATRPGVLILTSEREQGSALTLVREARSLFDDIRTILIGDNRDDLLMAGHSNTAAVPSEDDWFGEEQPLVSMIRSLALGKRYRSGSVRAKVNSVSRVNPWPIRDYQVGRDGTPGPYEALVVLLRKELPLLDDNGRELILESAVGVACTDGEIEAEEDA